VKILAIDTSTSIAGVCLFSEDGIIGEFLMNNLKSHSKNLVPMVDELLKYVNVEMEDIDVIAVSLGPGSFTGLRIGLSVAKGFSYSLGKPIVGISSLDGLAQNVAHFDGIICPMIDSKNGQVYTALYKSENQKIERISEPYCTDLEGLINIISEKRDILFVGDGIYLWEADIRNKLGERAYFAQASHNSVRASSIAQLAYHRAQEGDFDDLFKLVPIYIKKSQAEIAYEKRLGGNDGRCQDN